VIKDRIGKGRWSVRIHEVRITARRSVRGVTNEIAIADIAADNVGRYTIVRRTHVKQVAIVNGRYACLAVAVPDVMSIDVRLERGRVEISAQDYPCYLIEVASLNNDRRGQGACADVDAIVGLAGAAGENDVGQFDGSTRPGNVDANDPINAGLATTVTIRDATSNEGKLFARKPGYRVKRSAGFLPRMVCCIVAKVDEIGVLTVEHHRPTGRAR
jgi:hypothetical protein